jgi:hypothetical protein
MQAKKDPCQMTGEELKRDAKKKDEKWWDFIGDLLEAAIEIAADILDAVF